MPEASAKTIETGQKRRSQWLAVFAIVGGLIWLLFWPSCQRFEPPSPNASLAEFAEVMPAPRFLHLDETTGHIIWLGPVYNSTVSGGAVYVFDENQELMDWSYTSGDGEKIEGIGQRENYREITLEEALDMRK